MLGDCGGQLDFQPRSLPAELRAAFFSGRDLVTVPAERIRGLLVLGNEAVDLLLIVLDLLVEPQDGRLPLFDFASKSSSCPFNTRNSLRREMRPQEAFRGPTINVPSAARNSPAKVTKLSPGEDEWANANACRRLSTIHVRPE